MNKLICHGCKVENAVLTAENTTYSNLIDFKWTIAVSDKFSNFSVQAHTNQQENPFVHIEGANCQLEYENTFGIWRVESDGTPLGTRVLINGTPIPEMQLQVLEIIGVKGGITLNIIAYGLCASVERTSARTLIKAGETILGGIARVTIKYGVREPLNEFELTMEDNNANF